MPLLADRSEVERLVAAAPFRSAEVPVAGSRPIVAFAARGHASCAGLPRHRKSKTNAQSGDFQGWN